MSDSIQKLIRAAEYAIGVLYQTESYKEKGLAAKAVDELLLALAEVKEEMRGTK